MANFPSNTDILEAAEGRVRAHESELRQELGTFDLALAQVAYMITLEFFGAATKAGPSHAVLWLAGIALFFVPLAIVVIYLNDRMPLEGGLYEWARLGFNDGIGFLVAWNLWLYIVLLVGEYGFVLITYVAFAIGQQAQWMAASKGIIFASSVLLVAALVVISALGLRIGKWVINGGGLMTIFCLSLLIVLAAVRHWIPGDTAPKALPLVVPPLSLSSLSVFSKMTFGALCGFEFVAILAGECRNPVRTIGRSVLISAPIIAAFYIFGTSAILAFVPADQIDLIGPVPQALTMALRSYGAAAKILAPIAVLLLFTNVFCTGCLTFGASARLPMVAGWEGIVPTWFTTLHPKYKTPINSVFFAAIATLIACVIALVGVNQEEAFSLIQIWGFTLYGLVYLAMFAIPVLSGKLGTRASLGVKVAAVSGFVVTLLFVVLSVFPVIDVSNPASYAWKTIAVVAGVNGVGVVLYLRARRRVPSTAKAAVS
jgi:amino acid transporter